MMTQRNSDSISFRLFDHQLTGNGLLKLSRILCVLILWAGLPFITGPGYSADMKRYDRLLSKSPDSPWKIQADDIIYHESTQQYRATGNVVIRQDDKILSADEVIVRMDTMTASATGNVRLKAGEDELTASRMEFNLTEETGVLYDGEVFLTESQFHIKGDRVEQTRRYTYKIENAWVTTCEGDDPAWRITGKNVDVTLNGYGIVKHGTLWAKNIPVFYTPFFFFPVMLDRQSGLLIPNMGLSDRKGFEFDQPLYWAIDDSSDLTFYDHYMTKRGHKIGLEYRYVLDYQSKGTLKADFLKDRKTDDGMSISDDDYGYDHDIWDRTNTDRYWVRMKHDQALGPEFSMKLDLDVVSDQDFLIEFRGGHTGYYDSQDYFVKKYGRPIDSYEDTTRTNRFNLNKWGNVYSLNAGLKWYDDVIARRHLDENTTLQKLPQITFNTLKQPLFDSPFYWDMGSEYIYFYSEDDTNGHRMDIYPRFYFPYYRNRYFSFEPSVGFRQTLWRTETFQDSPLEANKDKTEFRSHYDIMLDLRSELYKIYPSSIGSITDIRHTIVPRFVYEYIPRKDQDDLPWYGGLDDDINRIDEGQRITFYLTQFLTTRSKVKRQHPPSTENGGHNTIETYHQLMRFELSQAYDINEAREKNPVEYRNGRDKRPFLPLDVELELMCNDFFSIWADARWCHYDNHLLSRNVELRWQDERGDRFHIDYRYTDDLLESLNADVGVRLTDLISVYGGYERNLLDNRTLETSLGVVYDTQCWALDVRMEEDDDDRKIEFRVNLKGLGEIGSD